MKIASVSSSTVFENQQNVSSEFSCEIFFFLIRAWKKENGQT